MSGVIPITYLYTNALHAKLVAAALGGIVWFDEKLMHWRPEGSEIHVSVEYHPPYEPFDPDEYAAKLWAEWEKAGAVL